MPDRKTLAKIHIAKKELNLSDTEYRQILKKCFGVETSKHLTQQQAEMLISIFVDMGYKPKTREQSGRKKFDHIGEREEFATPAQMRKIEALWKATGVKQELNIFLQKKFKVISLENLPADKVSKVIKAIQSIRDKRCNCEKADKEEEAVEW